VGCSYASIGSSIENDSGERGIIVNRPTKIDNQHFVQIKLPEETMGMCAKEGCNNFAYLGDGYCIKCWDKGFGFDVQFPAQYNRKKMGQQTLRKNTW